MSGRVTFVQQHLSPDQTFATLIKKSTYALSSTVREYSQNIEVENSSTEIIVDGELIPWSYLRENDVIFH